jgi:membrane fusion protein, multidrug efflux system
MQWVVSDMRGLASCSVDHARRWFVLFAFGVLASASGCRAAERTPGSHEAGTPASSVTRRPAETFRVESARLESTLRLPAELVADRKVDVYAKVNAYVRNLRVDIGATVHEGDVLVQLEAPEIEAQLASANARWKALEALHVASKATYERTVGASAIEGAVARDAVDQSRAKEQADAAQVAAAKATYDELRAMKSYLVVRAPFDGVVTERNVELGTYVGPSGKGSNKPMLVVQSVDKMRLTVSVQEAYSPYVRVGDTLQFSVRTLPGRMFSARVARKAGALDAALRAERIEADLDNRDRALVPLMVADARLALASPAPTLIIPRTALVESAMGTYVLRVRDGKANRVPVARGTRAGDKVEVFGELGPGDVLLLKATEEMQDGMPVAGR